MPRARERVAEAERAGRAADHDMIYLEPFCGHEAIRAYFEKVRSIVPPDLKFAVEDITEGDARAAGVKWCAAPQARARRLVTTR